MYSYESCKDTRWVLSLAFFRLVELEREPTLKNNNREHMPWRAFRLVVFPVIRREWVEAADYI